MKYCEGDGLGSDRLITRAEANGTLTVLANEYEANRFNSPNDLAVDSNGRIYFTDPLNGESSDVQQLESTESRSKASTESRQ